MDSLASRNNDDGPIGKRQWEGKRGHEEGEVTNSFCPRQLIYLRYYVTFNTVQVISHLSFLGRGNQHIQLVKVLYCKLPTFGKQLQTLPLKVWGLNSCPLRCKAHVLQLLHLGPFVQGRQQWSQCHFL